MNLSYTANSNKFIELMKNNENYSTFSKIAKKMNVSRQYIHQIISDSNHISVEKRILFINKLDLNDSYFVLVDKSPDNKKQPENSVKCTKNSIIKMFKFLNKNYSKHLSKTKAEFFKKDIKNFTDLLEKL